MKRLGRILLLISILILYLIIIDIILSSHYVELGECAARIYYKPLSITDYILLPILGITLVSISLRYIRTNKAVRYIEVSIYSIIIMLTLVFGNEILASRTIDWPETYQVQPIEIVNLTDCALNIMR